MMVASILVDQNKDFYTQHIVVCLLYVWITPLVLYTYSDIIFYTAVLFLKLPTFNFKFSKE